MKTIVVTNTYKGAVLDIVRSCVPAGFEIKLLEANTQEALCACVEDVDYILASGRVKINREVLERAKKLKMVQRTGVGLDSLDIPELAAHGIPLYVNSGVNAESVAEHTLLMMLACLRKLPEINRNTHSGVWDKQKQGIQTYELSGKTVGLVGMGNIAQTVVRLLMPFGVKKYYYSIPRLTETEEQAYGLTYFEHVEDMLSEVDILTLHCPLMDDTRHMINADTIQKMKPNAIIINTARGPLIETEALAQALMESRIAAAGLDVYEQEPLNAGNPLLLLENVIMTPHIGGVTYDSFHRMIQRAMENIACFENGEKEVIEPYLYKLV